MRDWLDQGAAEAGVVSLPARGLDTAILGDQDIVTVVRVGHRLADWNEVGYAELAKEPFIRSTGGCAEVFTPVARRVGVEFDMAFEARKMSAVSRSSGRGSASASCRAPACPICPTVWSFARLYRKQSGVSASLFLRARLRPPARSSTRLRRSISTKSRR